MYAVIRSGGKQYRVEPGETIEVERLEGEVGGKVTFDKRRRRPHRRQEDSGRRRSRQGQGDRQDREASCAVRSSRC